MTHDDRAPITGVILVGGKSSRFGSDKAWADLAGRPLLQWVASALAVTCRELLVVHAARQPLPELTVPVPTLHVSDRYDTEGPLAGMVTAFPRVRTGLCFVASVDAPLLVPALVRYLSSLAHEFDAVIPVAGGFRQPLLAVYRPRTCLEPFEAALAAGERRVLGALAPLRVREVDEAALAAIDPGLRSFQNTNTAGMLAEVAALLDTAP